MGALDPRVASWGRVLPGAYNVASPHPHPTHTFSATKRPLIGKSSWVVAGKVEGMCSRHTHTRAHTHTLRLLESGDWCTGPQGTLSASLGGSLSPSCSAFSSLPPFPHLIFASTFGPGREQKVHPRLTQFLIPPSVWSPLLANCSWHLGALFNTRRSQDC